MAGATDDNQLKSAPKEMTVAAAARRFGRSYDSGNGGGDGNGDGDGDDDGDGNSDSDGDGNGDSDSCGYGNGDGDSGGGSGGGGGGGSGRWMVEFTWRASPRSCLRATGTPSTPSGAGTGTR